VNFYEQYISEFLAENKEVSLEKIGIIKLTGNYVDAETQSVPVEFIYDKRAETSPELAEFISSRSGKNKMLIASDLESHLTQAREFINIGKTYEIINAGFIKKNNSGVYELIPYSQAVKAQKNFNQPATRSTRTRKKGSGAVQLFTLIIVLAIVGGLGYEAYQFFLKPAPQNASEAESVDTTKNNDIALNAVNSTDTAHKIYNANDSVPVRYIFETTNLLLRAQSRTAKLKSFGNNAGYDSVSNGAGKLYSLYIEKTTKLSDTLAVKDSLAKFFQKDITVKIAPGQ
jgi:hypothetical protein